jgi:putative flippase GtrA
MMAASRLPDDWLRFIRFLFAGGINTCFGYAAFAFFIWTGLPNDFAVTCSMIAGVAFNFGTFGKVFASRGFTALPAFLGVYGLLLIANIFLLRALVTAGFGPYLGQAIVVAILTPISFLALKRLVFTPAPELHP